MPTLRKVMTADIDSAVDDRIVTVTCSTETLGRDDIVMLSDGIDLTAYRTNPVFLFQHNPDWPVARAETIDVLDGNLVATVRFPEPGVSPRADEVYGLIRSGVINAASTGFETLDAEPLDASKPGAGLRILACELQEVSFVSIPAVPDALITERAMAHARSRMRTPLVATPSPEAERMKRSLITRGLYDVGCLARLLEELGWTKSCAEWEAEIEQDGSTVPAQLGEAMKALGDVLIAMTVEEVGELVGGGAADLPIPIGEEEAVIVTQAATAGLARFRIGADRARAEQKPADLQTRLVGRSMVFHRRMAKLFETELAAAR